jgi:hypothetical protein
MTILAGGIQFNPPLHFIINELIQQNGLDLLEVELSKVTFEESLMV